MKIGFCNITYIVNPLKLGGCDGSNNVGIGGDSYVDIVCDHSVCVTLFKNTLRSFIISRSAQLRMWNLIQLLRTSNWFGTKVKI